MLLQRGHTGLKDKFRQMRNPSGGLRLPKASDLIHGKRSHTAGVFGCDIAVAVVRLDHGAVIDGLSFYEIIQNLRFTGGILHGQIGRSAEKKEDLMHFRLPDGKNFPSFVSPDRGMKSFFQ